MKAYEFDEHGKAKEIESRPKAAMSSIRLASASSNCR
jgi:hypothetical protein